MDKGTVVLPWDAEEIDDVHSITAFTQRAKRQQNLGVVVTDDPLLCTW